MNVRALKPAVLALGLGAILGGVWLYQQTRTVDPGLHQDIAGTIAQLAAIDARWNEEILKSRLQLKTNDNAVIESLTTQASLEQRLNSAIAAAAGDDATLRTPLTDYQASIVTKNHLVEQFKSQNSVLRTSTLFITSSVRPLVERIREARKDQPPAQAKLLGELDEQMGSLLSAFLEYGSKSQEKTVGLMQQRMQAIRQLAGAPQVPRGLNDLTTTFLNHVDAVIETKPAVDELLVQILALPTTQHLGTVKTAYDAMREQRQTQGNWYQVLLVAYLAAVAILITFFTLRVLNKRRIGMLTAMNEALEKKVELSKELDKAYQELKASQARLVQTEKMSALGQMVAGVAHQLNTPLAFSHNNVSMALESLRSFETPLMLANKIAESVRDAEGGRLSVDVRQAKQTLAQYDPADTDVTMLSHMLNDTLQGIDQMKELVENLRDFTRLDRAKTTDFELNTGLRNVVYIAKSVIPTRVRVVEDYQQLPMLRCNPSQLNQVFLNLINNAAQAIKGEGTVTVKSSLDGDHVRIDVIDSGSGIAPDVLPRIFDEYFTTKPRGEGTGLGLPIAKTIVEEHGGELKVASELGKGTTFTVRLPVAAGEELKKAA